MSLRYSFRHLFFGGKLNKRRLYNILEDLDSANGGETTDITALKNTVGDNSKGLVKKTTDLETAVGDNSSGLVKGVADINTAIGDEDTVGSILYRLKALEDAE